MANTIHFFKNILVSNLNNLFLNFQYIFHLNAILQCSYFVLQLLIQKSSNPDNKKD